MKLRAVLLAIALILFVCALGATFVSVEAWPTVLWTGLIAAALAIERRLYGSPQAAPPGAAWQPTGERFNDDATGKPVEVWFNAETGERKYVERNA